MSWKLKDGKWAPGSTEARAAGCLCPILDNCHGMFPPIPAGSWWFNADCEYHEADFDVE